MGRVFNPKLVTITYAGYALTGFSEDSVITIEREEEGKLGHDGVMGEHSYSVNANRNYLATITLASNSPFVGILRDLADSEEFHSFSVVNMNSGAQDISTSEAYIVQAPDYVVGKEIEDVDIEIRLIDPTFS